MNGLAIPKYVVQLRSGADIELERSEAELVQEVLANATEHKFIRVSNQSLNTADIVSVLTPEEATGAEMKRRGLWKCKFGNYHERRGQCNCGREFKKSTDTKDEILPIPDKLKSKSLVFLSKQAQTDQRAVKFGAMGVGWTGCYFYLAVLKNKSTGRPDKMYELEAIIKEENKREFLADLNLQNIIEKGEQA